MFVRATIFVLYLLLSPLATQAAETVFSCDVVQDLSGARSRTVITLDSDAGIVSHLKRAWRDGATFSLFPDDEQFVDITADRLMWGQLRTRDSVLLDRFTLDLKTGRYAWFDGDGQRIAHGECRLPALAS